MLLRRRPPAIDDVAVKLGPGFEYLDKRWVVLLRWLNANHVEYVLVGGAAAAIRGQLDATGPLAIVPSPYRRNLERLQRALTHAHARLRLLDQNAENTAVKITAEKLGRRQRWELRCGVYDLDVEPSPTAAGGYQELLYEAARFTLADEVSVEVAAPEDIEHYRQLTALGFAPEFRVARGATVPHDTPERPL
jgi:uncharacterized lipoprotein